jgi:ABC-2 type transport system permease protein
MHVPKQSESHRWQRGLTRQGQLGLLTTLLTPGLKRTRRALKPNARGALIRNLVFVSFATLFMVGTGLAARWLFSQFASVETLAHLLITRTLSLALMFFSGLLIFSNLVSAFTTFFLAPELERLRGDPISSTQLCFARLITNWTQTSWSMFLFLLPMMWGAGPALGAPPEFYLIVVVSIIPLTLMCATIGTTTCVLMTRFFPAKRSRDILVLLAIIAFVIGYVAFRLAEPEKYLEPGGFKDLIAVISSMESDTQGASPVYWITDALIATTRGDLATLSKALIMLYSSATACVYLATIIGGRLYHHAYSSAHERPANAARSVQREHKRWQPKPTPSKAIVRRDQIIFMRTPSQWTQLLLVGALVIVYLLNFKYFRTLQDSGILGSIGIFGINFGLSGLVIATLAVRFLFPSISLEGKAFWCIESAPIEHQLLFNAKRAWGLIPILCIGSALCAGAGVITELSAPLIVVSIMVSMLYSWTVCSMGTYLGGFDPQFNLDNPARVASSMTAVAFMMGAMFMLVTQLGLSLQPIWVFERYVTRGIASSPTSIAISLVLVITLCALSIGAIFITRRIGLKGLSARQ